MKVDIKKLVAKLLGCSYKLVTSGNWTYREYPNGLVEAWYYGSNVPYSGVNTSIPLPHTVQKIIALNGDGIINGTALAPLVNLWVSSSRNVCITFNASGTTLDRLGLYVVYMKA